MVLEPSPLSRFQLRALVPLDPSPADNRLFLAINEYLLGCLAENKSPFTIEVYSQRLGTFARFMQKAGWSGGPGDVTKQHVTLFLVYLINQGLKSATVNAYYRALQTFFSRLKEDEQIPINPMEHVKPPRVDKTLRKPFSPEDIDRILGCCAGATFLDVRNRAMVLIFMDSGIRLNEMCHIRLEDISSDVQSVTVMGKGAKERTVRFGSMAQKALLLYLNMRRDRLPHLWVSEENTPLTHDGLRLVIRKLCLRAGVHGVKLGPHTFRHNFATMSIRNGANLFHVQTLLGHSSLNMTRVYAQMVDGEDAMQEHRNFSPVDNLLRKKKNSPGGV